MLNDGLLAFILFAPLVAYLVVVTPALWWMEHRDLSGDDHEMAASRS